ncbi:MAG: 4-hydroxy-tetrahydrodipicolinate reductase [Bacteroidales bacterium]|nr:4-hydroxy-tetrahydrodipicolinate reductase [Bacteroidales bacterium]
MRVAILGYGKMGHVVEKVLLERRHEIVAVIDNEADWQRLDNEFRRAEVAIDFSEPSVAVSNMFRAFEAHVPVVVGTTGWLDRLEEVCKRCADANGKLVYGSNFSIGVNIFFRVNRLLSKLMNTQDRYHVTMEETHHIHKKDAPSGTAIHLAQDIIHEVDALKEWQLTPCDHTNVVPITAIREGEVPGTHKIVWDSPEDTIEITHTAHGREGFARGAVHAAEWLVLQPSGVYPFEKCLIDN